MLVRNRNLQNILHVDNGVILEGVWDVTLLGNKIVLATTWLM